MLNNCKDKGRVKKLKSGEKGCSDAGVKTFWALV